MKRIRFALSYLRHWIEWRDHEAALYMARLRCRARKN